LRNKIGILPEKIPEIPNNLAGIVFKNQSSSGNKARIIAVGDVGFSNRVGEIGLAKGFDSFFEFVSPFLCSSDVVIGNLETPLLESWQNRSFAGPTQAAQFLNGAGFTIINLANNHIYDYGPEGLHSTLDACNRAGLIPIGAGDKSALAKKLVSIDVNGIKIGWLGCARTLASQKSFGPQYWEYDPDDLITHAKKSKELVDILIVSIHIGYMYIDYPHPEHKRVAENLMDHGVDLILMHHAHVLQGVDTHPSGGIICYNLGNFLLDTEDGNVIPDVMIEEQKQSAVFVFDIDKKGICFAAALPTYFDDEFQIHWAEGEVGSRILNRLDRISKDLRSDYLSAFHQQRVRRNTGLGIKVFFNNIKTGNWKSLKENLIQIRIRHIFMVLRWIFSNGS